MKNRNRYIVTDRTVLHDPDNAPVIEDCGESRPCLRKLADKLGGRGLYLVREPRRGARAVICEIRQREAAR